MVTVPVKDSFVENMIILITLLITIFLSVILYWFLYLSTQQLSPLTSLWQIRKDGKDFQDGLLQLSMKVVFFLAKNPTHATFSPDPVFCNSCQDCTIKSSQTTPSWRENIFLEALLKQVSDEQDSTTINSSDPVVARKTETTREKVIMRTWIRLFITGRNTNLP